MVNIDRKDMQSLQEKFLNNSTYDSLCSNIHFFCFDLGFPRHVIWFMPPQVPDGFASKCFCVTRNVWLLLFFFRLESDDWGVWDIWLSDEARSFPFNWWMMRKMCFKRWWEKTCFKGCVRWQRPLSTWTSQGQNGHKMFSKDSSGTDKWKTNWLDHMLVFVLFGGKDLCNQIVARFQRRRTLLGLKYA